MPVISVTERAHANCARSLDSSTALAKVFAGSRWGNCHRAHSKGILRLPCRNFLAPAFLLRKCCACHSTSCACHETCTEGSQSLPPAMDFCHPKEIPEKTHATHVQHTCNTRATRRATGAFLLRIPMIFARRCKIFSFSF